MPFLLLGIFLFFFGVYFLRRSIGDEDKEGIIGMTALIIASIILIMFFGLFYTFTIL